MPASELIERVSQLIAAHQGNVPASIGEQMAALDRRLRQPLRVAVAGRVKAGKSTLVNALLGQRVAPTDVSECTRVVTWFSYGHPERLEVLLRDGRTVEAQLTEDGMLPAQLPVPIDQIAALHAYLANAGLQSMTLIDTPGLGSVHDDYSRASRELLAADSSQAASAADAVVFLLGSAVMADELETLQLFQTDESRSSAANAVGVLTRADQLSDGTRDSWTVAVELAAKFAETFRSEVATVVPVIGLIAETAEAALLTEPDAMRLEKLAAIDAHERERMLWSADHFTTSEGPLTGEEREHLLMLLDLYGLTRAADALAGGVTGATALRGHLSQLSGIAAVKQTLSAYFGEQDHVLKVRSALDVLRKLSYSHVEPAVAPELAKLRADVEALALDPVMQPIAELEVAHEINAGHVTLPDGLLAELRLLFAPGSPRTRLDADSDDPAALREAARQAMIRWRTYMNTNASPAQGHCCRAVLRSYQLLWQQYAQ
jgi:predicted GTPase